MTVVIDRPATRTQRPQPASGRPGVAWTAAISLAAVLALADGFWLTALRGAVGVVGRDQGQFTTWWHESVVVLPIFLLAVLAAMTLALRRFGPRIRLRTTLGTALLVALAGSVVGIAQLALTSAYDYHLQVGEIHHMARLGHGCASSACLAQEQRATLSVHITAVMYVGRWVLLTNLVLVAWMIAMLGGRIRLRTTRSPFAGFTARWTSRADDVRAWTAAALVGAAAVHLAVMPAHLSEWPAAGTFFAFLTVGELGAAGYLLVRPSRRSALLAALVSIGPVVVWTWSRVVGLPFGPDPGATEPVGLPDIVATTLESATFVAALVLLRVPQWLRRPRLSSHAVALTAVAVLAVAVVGVSATSVLWPDVFGGPTSGVTALHHH